MSEAEDLREELDEERKARRSLQVELDRLEERVETHKRLLARLIGHGGVPDGE